MTRAVCVCVPARNEAERLPILLTALATQTIDRSLQVVLCINNSEDGGALIASAWAATASHRIDLDILEVDFPSPLAHVGAARRAAMARGVELLGDDAAMLISTDADCRPPPCWISAIQDALTEDDLIVGGRIVLDEDEPINPPLLALQRRWEGYWAEVRAIEDAIDPIPWDPAPRHGDHTGASLAMTVGLYRRAGGVPQVAVKEDLGLIEAAQAVGGRLVHPAGVWTRASARIEGRALGGMAEAMGRLAACAAGRTAPLVPDFDNWAARAEWRKAARRRWPVAEMLRQERLLLHMPCDMPLPDLD